MISLLCTDITSLTVAVAKCQSVLLEWHFDKGLYGVTLWQAALKHYRKNKRFNFCQHLSPCDEELLEWATIITDHYHRSWWLNRYMCMLFASQALTHQLYLVSTPVTSICWKAVLCFSTANIDKLFVSWPEGRIHWTLKHCFLQTYYPGLEWSLFNQNILDIGDMTHWHPPHSTSVVVLR